MFTTRRVLLLLSVAVLLRESCSNSPLGFLRDLKNRIFSSGNSTTSAEESSVQCSGLDQDGVCGVKNTTVNETIDESNVKSIETLNDSEYTNGTDSGLLEGIGTANSTQYYDDQDWNNAASNNTENYTNYIEYADNSQNVTELNTVAYASNDDEINDQTEKAREKRQINKVEININLTKLNKQVISGIRENYTDVIQNKSIPTDSTTSVNEIHTGGVQNESSFQDFVIPFDENNAIFKNETERDEIKIKKAEAKQKMNSALDNSAVVFGSNDTRIDNPESQNVTEERNNNNTIPIKCDSCVTTQERSTYLQNTSVNVDNGINETKNTEYEQGNFVENSTRVDNNVITRQTNNTNFKDILKNSTRIIETIVQNIVPAISNLSDITQANENNAAAIETVQSMEITEETKPSMTRTESSDKSDDVQLNSTIATVNITSEENGNTIIGTSNKTFVISTTNSTGSKPVVPNSNNSTVVEQNVMGKVIADASINIIDPITNSTEVKREKRSINFTILTDDDDYDEEDDDDTITHSASTLPDATDLPSTTVVNTTESSVWNDTQGIDIVGPICTKQYGQCTKSSDCCKDYECIVPEENNSTSYCDLRPMNLTLSTSLPNTTNNID